MNLKQRLQRLEQQATGFTRAVMAVVHGAWNEVDQQALEIAGVSAAVRDEIAQAAIQAFASACASFHFPLKDEETLQRFIDHVTRPSEIVLHNALSREEHARFVEARATLYD